MEYIFLVIACFLLAKTTRFAVWVNIERNYFLLV